MQNEINALLLDLKNMLLSTENEQNFDLDEITLFSNKVDCICSQILLLSAEERGNIIHLVKELLLFSDKLKNALILKKSVVEEKIKSFNSLQKASNAYAKNSTK